MKGGGAKEERSRDLPNTVVKYGEEPLCGQEVRARQ